MHKVVIVGAVRTPIGDIAGALAPLQATDLAVHAVKGVLEQSGVRPDDVEYTTFGWVVQDPRSSNLARNAAHFAGLPASAPATTFHENCNSGGAAIHSLARRLVLGEVQLGVAGGVESMSNVGRLLFAGRIKRQLYGDQTLVDGLFSALTDPFVGDGELMGLLSERLVDRYDLTREEQDEIAYRSHHNALRAWEEGWFDGYVLPTTAGRGRRAVTVTRDEHPRPVTREELAAARPYFKPDGGTITGLNSSSLNDGAAAVVLATEERARELGLEPLAELAAWHNVGVPREYMGEGAFKVIPGLLERGGVALSDVDLFEINEAFAAVLASAYHDLDGLDVERTNLWGSGISLGHPVGATGARQVVDMVHQLRRMDRELGVTTRCVGGGMGGAELLLRR